MVNKIESKLLNLLIICHNETHINFFLDAATSADEWNSTEKNIEIKFGYWLIKAETRRQRAEAKGKK